MALDGRGGVEEEVEDGEAVFGDIGMGGEEAAVKEGVVGVEGCGEGEVGGVEGCCGGDCCSGTIGVGARRGRRGDEERTEGGWDGRGCLCGSVGKSIFVKDDMTRNNDTTGGGIKAARGLMIIGETKINAG